MSAAQTIPERPAAGARRALFLLLAILGVTVAVYARGLSGALVYDDQLLIGRNPLIADLHNLPKLFRLGYWDFLDVREAQYIGYWRPLTAIVQALVWPFAATSPAPYHAVCLAIHLLAVSAAFFLALRLSGRTWIAAGTGLLFALHPAHVESVAWISALNDPLFGCLALLALERFLAWRERGSRGWPLVSLACFSLALLAKELAAALVPLLVLFDLLRRPAPHEARSELAPPAGLPAFLRRALGVFRAPLAPRRAYGPFAAAFALYMLARMLVFASPWAGFDRITTDFAVGALRLVLLRLEIFGGGLEILTVPIELSLFRPFRPYIEPFDPALLRAAVFSAVYAALLVACFLRARRVALAALLVIPAGLLPALIKVQSLGIFPLSERFLYLPVFGFALGAALLLDAALPRRAATVALLVLGALYAARSATRVGVFHDEETLFRDAAARSPRSVYAQWGLGRVLLERRNETGDPRYLAEARAVFERAEKLLLEAKSEHTDLMVTSRDYLQVNLGNAWCSIFEDDDSAAILVLQELVRRIEEIHGQEQKARELGVRVQDQFLDLDQVYTALGTAQYRARHFEEAEKSFQRALAAQPSSPETHQDYGRMLAAEERWEQAAQEFEAASRLRPGNAEDRLLLAQALQTLGQGERAAALARPLVDELPRRAEPLIVLATVALQSDNSAEALVWLDRALALAPRNAHAWYQKARALLLRSDRQGTIAAFRNAVELGPDDFAAHYDFGAYLLGQGAVAEALPYLVRAYVVAPEAHRAALRQTLAQLPCEDPEQLGQLAEADWKRGDLAAALDWNERALAHSEDLALYLRKARILRRQKNADAALAAFRACADRAPSDFTIWSELGGYLHELGRDEEARPVIEHALELDLPASYPPELRERAKADLKKLLETPGGSR